MSPERQGWENFLAWFAIYPRREARADAWKAWQQTERTRPALEELIDAVRRATAANEWSVDRRRYIPLPASWLRGQRWADEFDVPESVLPVLAPAKLRAPSEPPIDAAAAAGWDEARDAVQRDAMPDRGFTDTRTYAALKVVGWRTMQDMRPEKVRFVKMDFVAAFLAAPKSRVVQIGNRRAA